MNKFSWRCKFREYLYLLLMFNVAFILSDAGYDVWLGNYRGNTYSRAHEHLDPEEIDFWQFR